MAQVYTFTDSNGEIRLMAEINPAPGGGLPDPFEVTGTDPNSAVARFVGAVAQAANYLELLTSGAQTLLTVGPPGGGGLSYSPNPANSSALRFADNGDLHVSDGDGDEYLVYNSQASVKNLDLDPSNGQATVLSGFLRLAASSEPADALLPFNGCFILYVDGDDLKAKAKIGGNFVHATLGTFA